MKFGYTIRILRTVHEMNIEDLAAATGVTPSSISLWENDHRIPKASRWEQLAAVFGLTPTALIGLVGLDLKNLFSEDAIRRAIAEEGS